MLDEVFGAEQSFFLSSEGAEQYGTLEQMVLSMKIVGELNEQSNIGGIVKSAVVYLVTKDRRAVTIAVEMRRNDDVLLP